MAHPDQQPQTAQSQHSHLNPDERRAFCGRTVAFVLALDAPTPEAPARALQMHEGKPSVWWTVTAACKAQVANVYVLASPETVDNVAQVAYMVHTRGSGPMVQVVAYEAAQELAAPPTAEEPDPHGLPLDLMRAMRMLTDAVPGGGDAILILDAGAVDVTSGDIVDLCRNAREHPDSSTFTLQGDSPQPSVLMTYERLCKL